MPAKTITAAACTRIVEAASQSCHVPAVQNAIPQAAPANPNWDAIAIALTSQSNAIAFGAVVLAVIVAIAGVGWGVIITRNAEREARNEAQKEARAVAESEIRKWLEEDGTPMLRREMQAWRATFLAEAPISTPDVADLVEAAGKEDEDG